MTTQLSHARGTVNETLGHQTFECEKVRMHLLAPASCPTHCAYQAHIIGARVIGRGLQARGLLGECNHRFERNQRARQPSGQTIRQQAERAMSFSAIPASDSSAGRNFPLIGGVAAKRTTALRVQGATLQSCLTPGFLANVVVAGEPRWVSKLHQPSARTGTTVAGHLFVRVVVVGLAGSPPPRLRLRDGGQQ